MSDDQRISVGTQLRGAIKSRLDREIERLGGAKGMRQTVIEAALLDYFAKPDDERDKSVERILASNMVGGAKSLVQDAAVKAKHAAEVKSSRTRGPS